LRLQVSKKALIQIQEIYDFNANTYNINRAEKVLSSIDRIFERVATNYKLFPRYTANPNSSRNIRRALVKTKYKVIFEVFDDRIQILTIFHTAMDDRFLDL
jgi:plasmid stabilization system protein ParE